MNLSWPLGWFAYARSRFIPTFWHGTLTEDKKDAAGTFYRRNRYYDPQTGRFTQADPIGLAGGLNAYGFASGDPLSYSDPYGLCIWLWLKRCRDRTSRLTLGDFAYYLSVSAQASGDDPLFRRRAQRILSTATRVQRIAGELVGARLQQNRSFWSDDRLNAFRHIYGSCSLARELGAEDARQITNAHETTLRSGDWRQEEDSRADRENNRTGMRAGLDPGKAGRSCEDITDEHVQGGDYASRGW
jgi:RHS repeat-associated protein